MRFVLAVRDYSLDYQTRAGRQRVLQDVTLSIAAGEVLGLVGESGSGKTSLAWAIMRHLPGNARETPDGRIHLAGTDLRAASARMLETIHGRRMSMVFQDPSTALNPTLTIGRQVSEVLVRHRGLAEKEAWRAATEALEHVELRGAAGLMKRYPHEASGGEKQRVVIATAFACRPELIVFDEPTTALDVITGARILDLFARLRAETGVAALYISHDLALVSRVADRVAIIERGRIVEEAPSDRIFTTPAHDYTRRLVAAVPRPERRLVADAPAPERLLSAESIAVRYRRKQLFRPRPPAATADLRLDIRRGEILGVVGESGSGKSSLARALTGLADYSGTISLDGRRIGNAAGMNRAYRRAVQIVFQHPDSSLNPRHTVSALLARPLRLYGGDLGSIPALLAEVQLPAAYAGRYPHQLSGGEKQRVAIARAFAARPQLVICDEITAPLDVSVQASVVELLLRLRAAHGTSYLFITHDLNLVQQVAHRVVVMKDGAIVDLLGIDDLRAGQGHPYTRELLAAAPAPVGHS
jgi:peptide/nickel transport system ATP-binding protein